MTTTPAPAIAPASHQDNLLGICAALGEDFGFNPLWLRLALGVGLLFALEGVILGYLALGVVVLATRLLFPNPKPRPAASVTPLPVRTVAAPVAYARAA